MPINLVKTSFLNKCNMRTLWSEKGLKSLFQEKKKSLVELGDLHSHYKSQCKNNVFSLRVLVFKV